MVPSLPMHREMTTHQRRRSRLRLLPSRASSSPAVYGKMSRTAFARVTSSKLARQRASSRMSSEPSAKRRKSRVRRTS